MFASRWHSPPKPDSVLSWTTGTCSAAIRSASMLPCTSPSSTPARSRRGRASAALEQRRLARAGRAHQVDHRDPRAIEVVAVRVRDRRVGVERVLGDLHLGAMHVSSSLGLRDLDRLHLELRRRGRPRRRALSQPGQRNTGSTAASGSWPATGSGAGSHSRPHPPQRIHAGDDLEREPRALAVGVAGDDLEVEARATRARPGAARRRGRRPASPGRPPAWRSAVSTIALEIESSCIRAPRA